MSGTIPLLHLYAFMGYIETTILCKAENDRYRERNDVKEVLNNNIPEVLWHCVTVIVHVNLALMHVTCIFYNSVL